MPNIQFYQFFLLVFIFPIVVCAYLREDVMYMWGQVAAESRGGNHRATGALKHHVWVLETGIGSHTRAVCISQLSHLPT